MTSKWPKTSLGNVLRLTVDAISVDPSASYSMAGVYSFGRGLFARGPLSGSDTTYQELHRLHENDLVLSQLKAWEGAIARVPKSFDGWHLSPQFPTFRAIPQQLETKYLEWYCKLPTLWEELRGAARGMGARRDSVSPERFLSVTIPLPPLDEQRSIASRIEELAARIEQAQELRKESLEAASNATASLHINLSGSRLVPLRNILKLDERRVPVRPDGSYPQVGIKGFGGGLFPRGALDGTQTTYKEFNLLFDGALVLSQVKGWEGAIAVCGERFAGWYASPEYRTFSFISDEALPEYMSPIVVSPWFYTKLAGLTRGVGARRERTRPEAFLEMKIPMPSVKQQRWALQAFKELNSLKEMQSETAAELDALMPSILSRAFRGDL
jgi:type I restriction enzyme S subunit